MANTGDTPGQLNALVRAKTGDSSARAHSLETLPGHAGFSYSFVLERTDGGDPAGKLVLRLAPPNVRISGPADVVRQAKIMASMVRTAVPVPRVYWFGDEPEFFGRPYFVVSYVNGVKLADEPFPMEQTKPLARKGIETLAALHSLPWEPRRSAFGDPFPLSEEMKRLDNLLDRPTLDPTVVARAPELRECLRGTLPTHARIGCVHGDFQWSNLLFDGGRPVALIDWEIASIGPIMLDLGWVCFLFLRRPRRVGADDGATRPAAYSRRDNRDLCRFGYISGIAGRDPMVSSICCLSLRRDHMLQPDAASARQKDRCAMGRHRAVGAADVRTWAEIDRISRHGRSKSQKRANVDRAVRWSCMIDAAGFAVGRCCFRSLRDRASRITSLTVAFLAGVPHESSKPGR